MKSLNLIPFALLIVLVPVGSGSDFFYDEGARFAKQVSDFARSFRKAPDTTAVFSYVPKHGSDQRVRVRIGRIGWCPRPPCYPQGAATVFVERGKSGTGYAIGTAASVPEPLSVDKQGAPIRVFMRKINGMVEVIGLD